MKYRTLRARSVVGAVAAGEAAQKRDATEVRKRCVIVLRMCVDFMSLDTPRNIRKHIT